MRYFPVFLDLEGRTIAVAGGGDVAANKLRLFAKTGAKLLCTALAFNEEITALAASGRVTLRRLDPKWAPFGEAFVVIAATESSDDEAIAGRAQSLGILVNAVDKTEFCTFITPSFADRSPVVVAIGTEGQAPVLARRLREQIEIALPEHLGRLAAFIGAHREALAEVLPQTPDRRRFWENAVDGPIARLIAEGRDADALETLRQEMEEIRDRKSSPLGETSKNRRNSHETEMTAKVRNGAVTLIVSPSAPEDLTLKALRALQNADSIYYHDSVPNAVLDKARRDASREIFSELADAETRLIATVMDAERPSRLVCLLRHGQDGHAIYGLLRSLSEAGLAVDTCSVTQPLLAGAAETTIEPTPTQH